MPSDFAVVDFPGGLYAVATGVDGEDNSTSMAAITAFIEQSGCFIVDRTRAELGNIITSPTAAEAMGYAQMDYYVPIKIK